MAKGESVAVIGAGGFGLEVLQYAIEAREAGWGFEVEGFIDDERPLGDEVAGGYCVVGRSVESELSGRNVIIAVGDADARAAIASRVTEAGGRLVTLKHPTAYVAPSAILGDGCVLCPFTLVGVYATVGANVAMNVYASVGHESEVGSHSVLSPYSAVLGRVEIGEQVYLATHSTVAPGVTVGRKSKVSAGSLVNRSAPAGSLLAGNPAKGRVMFAAD